MTTATTSRPRSLQVLVGAVLVVDLLVLAYAVLVGGWTWWELHSNPDADPLTGLGYPVAALVAAPAVLSLLLLRLARTWRGRVGDALLGAAVLPPALLVLLALVGGLG